MKKNETSWGLVIMLLILGLVGYVQKTTAATMGQSDKAKTTKLDTAPTVTALNPPVKVNLGTTGASMAGAAYYIGMAMGYFTDLGIDLKLVTFDTADKTIPMLATNQIDAANGAISAGTFNAIAQNVDLKIISNGNSLTAGRGNVLLMVRKDLVDAGLVKTVKDLKNRKVAISAKGSMSEIVLDAALKKEGLSLKDVDETTMSYPNMLVAFSNKAIEATIINEPTATAAVKQGMGVKFLTGDKICPDKAVGFVQASPNFAANKEVAGRFLIAYLRSARNYNDAFAKNINKTEILRILMSALPQKNPEDYENMILPSIEVNGRIDIQGLTSDLNWYYSNKYVKTKPDLSKVFSTDIGDWARARIGEYKN